MSQKPAPKRLNTWQSLARAFLSWRTGSVTLMSFSSGMPLGLVWIAIPDWLRSSGVDIRVIGLITLAQAPWTFKFLWSPFMDRYTPGFLGRRRGWALLTQVALFAVSLMLAGVGDQPEAPWIVGALALAMAFAAASQDIAVDAYAVDVLRPEEHGVAVGARTALYRAAMFVAGGGAISLAGAWGWGKVNLMLGCLYLPIMLITWLAPEPEEAVINPKTIKEAVWYPFLGFLSRHRALEILAFVMFYKLADNLAQGLQRPFLVDLGFSDVDRGANLALLGVFTIVIGTLLGGVLTSFMGLGHALWVFGLIQIFSNVGYALLAMDGTVNRPLMFAAFGFESFSSGLGSGAFGVLLLRMTQKRFSATQYALFSSLFGLPRIIAGPIIGFAVYAVGWEIFFWSTLAAGIPGLILLSRFVPIGTREPTFTVEAPKQRRPLRRGELALRGAVGAVCGAVFAALTLVSMEALRGIREGEGFLFEASLRGLFAPEDWRGWVTWVGILVFGVVCGLFTAAVVAARHGLG
ncbi:MAG TPA: MFS transporter, partial [Thermoanaerobaculia bacterium]|nr:MFS transporter [Thermoanaerobaculia bacterium]